MKTILIRAFLLLVIGALLMVCISTNVFDNWLALIGTGVPMWVFIIMILLAVNLFYQSRILKTLRSFNRSEDDQP